MYFVSELMLRKGHGGLRKGPKKEEGSERLRRGRDQIKLIHLKQRNEGESERLREEGDQMKFIDLWFER